MKAVAKPSSSKPLAVVTGGNRGIGQEICRQLAAQGMQVVLTARDPKKGAAAAKAMKAEGFDVTFRKLDVTDPRSIAGLVRWLRPEFQKPAAARAPEQAELETGTGDAAVEVAAAQKRAWPTELPDQVRTVAQVLAEARQPMTADELAARFTGRGPWKKRLPQVLATLEAVGRLRKTDAGAYSTA